MPAASRAIVCLVVWNCVAPSALAADTWSDPYPGVQHLLRTNSTPQRFHVAIIDLSLPHIRVRATPPSLAGSTVSEFAGATGSEVAINGDFFCAGTTLDFCDGESFYQPWGLAIGAGDQWFGTSDDSNMGFFAAGEDNQAVVSLPVEEIEPPEPWMVEAVGGAPTIVSGGVATDPYDCYYHKCEERHPRTGVGLSEDGRWLYLIVVDGRSSSSAGATTRELGEVLASLGAWRALSLDGGGSSAMFIEGMGGIMNVPSDGWERVVGNHLGVDVDVPTARCTYLKKVACGAYGCGCVEDDCAGGYCPGSGCTDDQSTDCGMFGCGCVDGACSGGYCEGSGCTAKRSIECDEAAACGCELMECAPCEGMESESEGEGESEGEEGESEGEAVGEAEAEGEAEPTGEAKGGCACSLGAMR